MGSAVRSSSVRWHAVDLSRHSDVDLILVQETDKRFLDRYDGILAEITTALGRHAVDLLIYTPEELAAIRRSPLRGNGLARGRGAL